MIDRIKKLIEPLKVKENPSINHQHFDGLDSSIDEYEVVLNIDQGKLTCLFSIIKKAYPWAGLALIESTKIFIECPASLQLKIESKRSFISRKRTLSVNTTDTTIRQLLQPNESILALFKKQPELVIYTTNQISSQSFSYPPKMFLVAKLKTILTQEQFAQLIHSFREFLFILSKLH